MSDGHFHSQAHRELQMLLRASRLRHWNGNGERAGAAHHACRCNLLRRQAQSAEGLASPASSLADPATRA